MQYDIERFPAQSGRLIGEDGKVYNLIDLLKDIANNAGNKPAKPTVDKVTTTTSGAIVELT